MARSGSRSPVTLVPFAPEHIPAATALVTSRVAQLRDAVPALPDAAATTRRMGAALSALAARGDGLVALERGDVTGFQGALLNDGRINRWAYTPDAARAAAGTRPRAAIEALYAALADRWVQAGCLEHVVTILTDDAVALDAFGRLGFGWTTVDLVRDLSPVLGAGAGSGRGTVRIRRAGPTDVDTIIQLEEGLRRHLAAPPVFLPLGAQASPEIQRRRLEDRSTATLLAEDGDTAIAYLRIGPCATDVATVVQDVSTASITGAFTVAERRGGGVASALLHAAVRWAREAGYVRCAVDHESANVEAARFWRRHFTPVAYSLTRRLPAQVGR
jgi:GNAT superfamily N-acetyltransferase